MSTAFANAPLIAALREPTSTRDLSPRQWNDLLLRAREQGLLARLSVHLADRGLLSAAPAKAQAHMHAACIAVASSHTAVRFELNRVLRALTGVDAPIILLKGAAYLMAALPASRGRWVGDLDLMIPRGHLDEVERALMAKGWSPGEIDQYDQHYYRQWMHEIPPLQHPQRETPVDLHHTIAPLTSKVRPDADALLASSIALANPRLRVLGPADMVLHSTVHLFNDVVGKPLRDLFDLHDLLCHFSQRAGFWDELLARAELHRLGRPLHYMLRHTGRLLGTPIPAEVQRAAQAYAPAAWLAPIMDGLFAAQLLPRSSSRQGARVTLALWLLYLRTHWLRMPAPMLVRHLAIKAARRLRERFERKPKADEQAA